jgi:c-di-GMP phosphodiesterase
MPPFYLGRQAIFDSNVKVFGYELLYRGFEYSDAMDTMDGDQATSEVLLNSFMELGLTQVVGDHRAFVNLTRKFLLNDRILPPPSNRLVLEILEGIDVDDELIQAVIRLKQKGYLLALDDYILDRKNEKLLEYTDFIKLDIKNMGRAEVRKHLVESRRYPLKCIAEKIETPDEFDWCKGLGFDYYQGFFLCRPRIVSGHRFPANRLNAMRMMANLNDPTIDIDGLENIISQDLTLSYKLLKYINCAAFGLSKEIESIRHAIVYLGEDEIRRWASLIALSEVEDKPGELIMTSLTRSKMCELLSYHVGKGNIRTAFMIGLLSTLDAIMDMPMKELITPLPLTQDTIEALLDRTGKYKDILECTLAYEQGDWNNVRCQGLSQALIADIYLQALEWAEKTIHVLGDRR